MSLRGLLDPGDWLAMKPQLNPEATPVEFHYRPEPFEVRARLVVGVLVVSLASVAGFFLRDDGVALLVVGGFALFGLLNAVYGVLQSRFSMSVEIAGLEVAVQRNSLWGASNWRESLRSWSRKCSDRPYRHGDAPARLAARLAACHPAQHFAILHPLGTSRP
jgi:hypothetical protein